MGPWKAFVQTAVYPEKELSWISGPTDDKHMNHYMEGPGEGRVYSCVAWIRSLMDFEKGVCVRMHMYSLGTLKIMLLSLGGFADDLPPRLRSLGVGRRWKIKQVVLRTHVLFLCSRCDVEYNCVYPGGIIDCL